MSWPRSGRTARPRLSSVLPCYNREAGVILISTRAGVATTANLRCDDALVGYYRRAAGEHPDWAKYRSTTVSARRVLITLTAEHVYGAVLG